MVTGRLRKSEDGFVVALPREEVERLGLVDGQTVTVEVRPVGTEEVLAADLRDAFEVEFREGQAGLRYLAEN